MLSAKCLLNELLAKLEFLQSLLVLIDFLKVGATCVHRSDLEIYLRIELLI